MIISFNRNNGGGGSGSGSTDLTNYWNSAVTEQHIESAASITYASATSYADQAVAGIDLSAYDTSAVTATKYSKVTTYPVSGYDVDLRYLYIETSGVSKELNIAAINGKAVIGLNQEYRTEFEFPTSADVQTQIVGALSAYTPTTGFSTINGSAITSGGNIVIEGGSETDTESSFPRMPYFSMEDGDVEAIKSALFDVNGDGDGMSDIWLLDTWYDWPDNIVSWDDAGVPPDFTIDTENLVAYIENIPAGNYIIGFSKGEPGENYDPEFDVSYYSKEDGQYSGMTIEATQDVWDNHDFVINSYWRNKFEGYICLSNNAEWYNWSFPKDVARFEIRIVDDGEGNESVEINIEYKDYQDQIDTIDEVVSDALNDLNGQIASAVMSQDIRNIVKIEQTAYDTLVAQSATSQTTLYVVVPDAQ